LRNKLLLSMSMVSTLLFATHYEVDRDHSLVGFKIRHAVVATVEGKFNDFMGEYEYDDQLHYFKAFHGEVQTASVDTHEPYRDKHLRNKVFDVEHYPHMSFDMITQEGGMFHGRLTLKGITKEVNLTIGRATQAEDTFLLSGTILRKDFNLTFSDMAEIGGIVVGDDVEINVMFRGKAKE